MTTETANRNPRIFISSTFRDMHAERNHLVRYVFPKLNETLRDKNIHVDVVDLRWGVTSDQNAIDACLGLIDESKPFFVGLLGERYGWIPPGKSISITEQEIQYAIGGENPRCPYSYFYFRNLRATKKIADNALLDFIEEPNSPKSILLDKLKSWIKNSDYSSRQYNAKWDKNSQQLKGLEAFGEMVYQDLLAGISEYYALESVKNLSPVEYDVLVSESFVASETSHYILPDRDLYNSLLDFARNTHSDTQIFHLGGERGTGKTAMLAYLVHELKSDEQLRVISYFPDVSSNTPHILDAVQELYYQLGSPETEARLEQNKLKDAVEMIAPETPIIIVIDSYEDIQSRLTVDSEEGNDWSMIWDLVAVHPSVKIIVSTSDKSLDYNAELNRLDIELRQSIVDQFLRKYGKRLDETQMSYLVNKEDAGLAAYLIISLNELRTLGTYEEMTDIIQQLPGTLDKLCAWILQRLESEPVLTENATVATSKLVEQVLSVIAVTRMGLSIAEIIEISEIRILRENVATLFQIIRPYLLIRSNTYSLENENLRYAIYSRYLDKDTETKWSSQIADYFLAKIEISHKGTSDYFSTPTGDREQLNRMRREAINLLERTERVDDLNKLKSSLRLGLVQERVHDSAKDSAYTIGLGRIADEIISQDVEKNEQRKVKRWHPQPAEYTGTTDAMRDYTDIYTYPCCGKQILSPDSYQPPQIILHGCQKLPKSDNIDRDVLRRAAEERARKKNSTGNDTQQETKHDSIISNLLNWFRKE